MASLNGAFFNSFDYCYRSVSFTPARTQVDADGLIRLVLCSQDPGLHNWLDSQGFEQGNLTYRNLLCNHNTELNTHLVKFSELDQHLPRNSHRVTAEQRKQELYQRFCAISKRRRI